MTATTEQQIAAWDDYVDARRRADRTLLIKDGREAVLAWKRFANLFLDDGRKMPLDEPDNVIRLRFPSNGTDDYRPGAA